MYRVTIKNLEFQVLRINKLTGSPETAYTKVDGKLIANIGHYHLDQAYGGIKLVRMDNEGGGISMVSSDGFGTKRQLSVWMDAFIAGLEANA